MSALSRTSFGGVGNMCIACAGGLSGSGSGIGGPAAPSFNIEQIIAQLDRNNIGWANGIVTYAFFEALNEDNLLDENYQGFQAFNAMQRQATRDAFALLADVANLTFIEAADNGASDNRMTFANSSTMPDYVWGWAGGRFYDLPEGQRDQWFSSEIWVNSDGGLGSYGLGTYNFTALMHEIMHGLGVPHPGDYNAAEGVDITYAGFAEYAQDSRQYTIMSYFDARETGAQHGFSYGATPLLHDILILQHIYGANMSTRAGDTVYGFNSNAGRDAFDFSINQEPIVAIWDGAGNDTIDLSFYVSNSVIDLREGGFSSFAGLTHNMAIAYGAVIENAIGGSGNDTLIGNAANNLLNGGAGADRMTGGAGDDIYIVDHVGDVVVELDGGGFDEIRSSLSFNLAGIYAERLVLTGSADIDAIGNSLQNRLVGNSGANVLNGMGGADEMAGGKGDDIYFVDHAGDRVYENAGEGFDEVRSSVSFDLAGTYVERLVLTGTGNINAVGNSLANRLVGNDGANLLNGLGGADDMAGGKGDDIYIVDNANDRVYENNREGFDEIQSSVSYNLAGIYVERLVLTGSGDLNAVGNSLDNRLVGNAGDNVLNGMGGADQMAGGLGDDTYHVDNARDRV
ncbi:M10 family metallopeptidase C-terminal domain-containing protein, partial [Brevundimonas lutea]|uniref:M10 family metallopeptidase C-terminal domain-containing protein n=1 Tax=Brevundimonas lutea TaxID=2293980 RepID=UPI00196AA93E